MIATHKSKTAFRSALAFAAFWLISTNVSFGQSDIDAHLRSGEFGPAIAAAKKSGDSDKWLAHISKEQFSSGAFLASYQTASQVNDGQQRNQAFSDLRQRSGNGAGGGIAAADFDELIDLIQNTIAPDSWTDTEGLGTIRAYPSGVFVDGAGTVKRLKKSKQVNWEQLRRQLNPSVGDSKSNTQLRKISITRLERQLEMLAAQGKPINDELRYLGGIYEVQYLLFYPETNDIVLAGPAGPWRYDIQGRAINIETGRPVLYLDDLVVCLRNAFENDGKFGCSIDPTEDRLKATQAFLATSKLQGASWRKQLRKTVGHQVVTVHGIDRQSHAARVIVEADYRMKLVGMGLEPSVAEVPNYLERVRLDKNGNPPPMDLARWWFTLNYEAVLASGKRDVFQFQGNGVQLQSESELLDEKGKRIHTGNARREAKTFAQDFTKHFDKLADKYPIYAELKNVFDMALVAALIRHENLDGKLNWNLSYFGSPKSSHSLTYEVIKGKNPKQVESVMNFRQIESRKGSRRFKHTIVGVSGGVEFAAREVIQRSKFKSAPNMNQLRQSNNPPVNEFGQWWWD